MRVADCTIRPCRFRCETCGIPSETPLCGRCSIINEADVELLKRHIERKKKETRNANRRAAEA